MSNTISVTEIRNALRCPRLFILGRQMKRPVAFPIGESWLGALFHQIVNELSLDPRSLRQPSASEAKLPMFRLIQTRLLERLANKIEENVELMASPQEIDDLAEALRQLAAYISSSVPAPEKRESVDVEKILSGSELSLENVVALPGADSVRITGRIDGLHHRATGAVELLEYKLTSEENAAIDQAQVSLYQWLLLEQHGVDAEPVVLRFQPTLEVTRIEKNSAKALVETQILPLLSKLQRWEQSPSETPATKTTTLCASCPVQQPCRDKFPSHPAERDAPASQIALGNSSAVVLTTMGGNPPARDLDGEAFADEARTKLEALCSSLAVPVVISPKPSIGARLVSFELTVKRAGKVSRLDQSSQDLIHHLHAKHGYAAQFEKRGGQRVVTLVRPKAREVRLSDLLAREQRWLSEEPGRLVIGEASDGTTLRADLSEPSQCHFLVAGTTGSGKSVLLKTIAISLVRYHPPSAIQLTLVDPKRVTFATLQKQLASHLAHPLCFDPDDALSLLEGLVDTMEERYTEFGREAVEHITEYNEVHPRKRLPRHVVIIDEFQDFLVDETTSAPFKKAVQRIGAKARAAGIHLVLATQRPDAKVVPPIIKSNLPGKLALKVASQVNSRIVLDKGGAEHLLGRGDLWADLGLGLVRAQVASPSP